MKTYVDSNNEEFEKAAEVKKQFDVLKNLFSELDNAKEVPEGFLQRVKEEVKIVLK